jgi:preprotein translocase subunit YajC
MNSTIVNMLPFIVMLGLFYLIVFMPESKRKKKFAAMLNDLKVNDEVMTRGGILGKIVNIQDNFLILQTGPDRTKIKIDKNGISSVLNKIVEEAVEVKVQENKEN